MWTDQVEVVNVVAESVHVAPWLDAVAHLESEISAALSVAVHRLQPHLHHGLGDGTRVAISRAVHDLQLHAMTCCCCCGMPRPSSPVTAAGTLLGWKYVSRRPSSSWRSRPRHSASNSRGLCKIDWVLASR